HRPARCSPTATGRALRSTSTPRRASMLLRICPFRPAPRTQKKPRRRRQSSPSTALEPPENTNAPATIAASTRADRSRSQPKPHTAARQPCILGQRPQGRTHKVLAADKHTLVVLDPGHFHAALTLRQRHPR